MIGVWCAMVTGTRITGTFLSLSLWDHKFTMICYNSDIICAWIVWYINTFLHHLEKISGDRITSRGFLPLHCILLVVHVKGQEYSEIKFVLNIFTHCELILWLCKSQNGRTKALQVFEKSQNQNYYWTRPLFYACLKLYLK